jgi:predicted nucleic acid-binding protein
VSARHTVAEVRRNLARLLEPTAAATPLAGLSLPISRQSRSSSSTQQRATSPRRSPSRALDALHLGAARRLGTAISFLTFDARQAEAARSLGFRVLGA